mmetsp:Transcript_22850/g.34150  ORF Transcript_22850/g.34150 Transcript_22850/m.34150 type:complete len:125 (-) Transcript_22850:23-397(-)
MGWSGQPELATLFGRLSWVTFVHLAHRRYCTPRIYNPTITLCSFAPMATVFLSPRRASFIGIARKDTKLADIQANRCIGLKHIRWCESKDCISKGGNGRSCTLAVQQVTSLQDDCKTVRPLGLR